MYEILPKPTYPGSKFTSYHVCKQGQFSGVRCDAMADAVFLKYVLNHAGDDVLQAARTAATTGEENVV